MYYNIVQASLQQSAAVSSRLAELEKENTNVKVICFYAFTIYNMYNSLYIQYTFSVFQ